MSARRVEVIAEIANAHQGEPEQCAALAEAGFAAGADAVKVQIYSGEELLVRAHPRFEHFRKQAFSPETWAGLLQRIARDGRAVYADVLGLGSLAVASKAVLAGYKIHASDLGNAPLLDAVAGLGRRVLVAVGGSTAPEIGAALARLGADHIRLGAGLKAQDSRERPPASSLQPPASATDRPVLLHGFQSYPTAVEDSCLARLRWLQEAFGERCEIGYMDHVDADDPLAFGLPLAAIGLGARVIEKHITLNRAARGVDHYSSLEPDEFARFVEQVRKLESAIGESPELFSAAEAAYRRQVKKQWVAVRALPQGHVLSSEDLIMKRAPEQPEEPPRWEDLVGRPLLAACREEAVVRRSAVPQVAWAAVVARMRSCRLPGKAMLDVGGMPALAHLLERLKQARRVDRIVLCTTREPEDDPLVELARRAGVAWFRGATEDVLARVLGAIEGHKVDLVLRVTGDDILVDPDYADRAVEHHLRVNAEYSDLKSLPSGTEVEVFDAALLRQLWAAMEDSGGTEYLTAYIARHRGQFRTCSVPVEPRHARRWRLTLDTAEDYALIGAVLEAMRSRGKALTYRLDDLVEILEAHPEWLARNAQTAQRGLPPEVCTDLAWGRLA